MKRPGLPLCAAVLATLCGVAFSGAAQPAYVPMLPAVALVQSDPGRTTLAFVIDARGWTASLARSVSSILDVAAFVTSHDEIELRLRALLLPELFPFRLAVEVGPREVTALGALHLGPLRLVGRRAWGEETTADVALCATTCRQLAIAVGTTIRGGLEPYVAASWLPRSTLWGLTVVVAARGVRFGFGGTW